MYLIDFNYNGKTLADYNSIVGYYDSSAETNLVTSTPLQLNTVQVNNTFMLASSLYTDAYSGVVNFVKNPCISTNVYYSEDEINEILKWLKRNRTYKKFKPIYDDGSFSDVYLMCVFTEVHLLTNGVGVVGFECSFETDAPWGHLEDITYNFSISSGSGANFFVLNVSQLNGVDLLSSSAGTTRAANSIIVDSGMDVWYAYPKMRIICRGNGDLAIHNSLTPNETTIISHCSVGEIIDFSGETKQITTNLSTHPKFFNDFNYIFPKIVATDESDVNVYTFSMDCDVTMTYSPITHITMI